MSNDFCAKVGQERAGARLDRFLAEALPDLSRSRLKALIVQGCVRAGGVVLDDPARKVKAGERFVVSVPEAVPPEPRAQAIALDILFEDAHLIVVNKPAGMVVHPAAGNWDGTLVNALIAHCGASLSGIGGVARPGIVHRLDKDTSGVMVAAKTDAAHRGLSEMFAQHDLERIYRAFVWGTPVPAAGRIEGAIGRSRQNRKKMAVVPAGGKRAVTHYRTLDAYGRLAALLECRLETGRTHQIRVHLTHRGHPILGDPVYGRPRLSTIIPPVRAAIDTLGRQALHAAVIGFRHPVTGRNLRFETALPNDLRMLMNLLESI
jgi:23S rRNA pseudouridine1911/1915/1917 synthase